MKRVLILVGGNCKRVAASSRQCSTITNAASTTALVVYRPSGALATQDLIYYNRLQEYINHSTSENSDEAQPNVLPLEGQWKTPSAIPGLSGPNHPQEGDGPGKNGDNILLQNISAKLISEAELEENVLKLRRYLFEKYSPQYPMPNKQLIARNFVTVLEDYDNSHHLKTFDREQVVRIYKSLLTQDYCRWIAPSDHKLGDLKALGYKLYSPKSGGTPEDYNRSQRYIRKAKKASKAPDTEKEPVSEYKTDEWLDKLRGTEEKRQEEKKAAKRIEWINRGLEKKRLSALETNEFEGWRSFDQEREVTNFNSEFWGSAVTDIIENTEKQSGLLHGKAIHIDSENQNDKTLKYEIAYAPLVTLDVLKIADQGSLPQFGLLGSLAGDLSISEDKQKSSNWSFFSLTRRSDADNFSKSIQENADRRIFLNTNAPSSTFICGLQGSGKSHTLACILENSLIPNSQLGILREPSAAIVFHFQKYSGSANFKPCEVAYLCGSTSLGSLDNGPNTVRAINVLVSRSNYKKMKEAYSRFPNVRVVPLLIKPKQLTVNTMLQLMAVNNKDSSPLYIEVMTSVLRKMAAESDEFDYAQFLENLNDTKFSRDQSAFLRMRINLLESFLGPNDDVDYLQAQEGGLTIVDLSCPFVDEDMACTLFNTCLDLYLSSSPQIRQKAVALDEAHKFLTMRNPAAQALTESLVACIRQQRHIGCRVLISTQEPTLSPQLLELSSFSVIHRFNSPAWLHLVSKHIGFDNDDPRVKTELLKQIMALQTGEALVYAPTAAIAVKDRKVELLGPHLTKIYVRKRLTSDGGATKMSVKVEGNDI